MKDLSSTAPKATILIVDDNPSIIRILSESLSFYGYEIQAVADGEKGIRIAQKILPDLIMLDINMPKMDGFEICQRLKADERTSPIPVIFISAMNHVEDKVKAFKMGGVDYVTKPFQVEEVLARIETHLAIRRLQTQLQEANKELESRLKDLSTAQNAEREQRILAETLRDTIAAINSSLDFNEVLDLIFDNLGRVVPHYSANIALLDEKNNLQVKRSRGYRPGEIEKLFQNLSGSGTNFPTLRQVIEHRNPVVVSDTRRDASWVMLPGWNWIRSYACAPIVVKDEVIGLFNLESPEPGFFKPIHGERLQTFANQAAVAIEKARLFNETQRLAITDELTSVFNRRHLLYRAEREFEHTVRYKRELSAIMIDIDHFKQVNDTCGHPVGDQALKILVRLCQRNVRSVDILGRYGGEEFLLLMPETGLQQAYSAAERIRGQVEESGLGVDKTLLKVTISLGVAAAELKPDFTISDLIKNADDALYAAKAAGRNCVRMYAAKS